MPALLPLLCFILIFLCFNKGTLTGPLCWRRSFLSASLVWGLLVLVSTELLSLRQAIAFETLLGFWILTTLAAGYFLSKNKNPLISFHPPAFSRLELSFSLSIVFLTIMIGLTALTAPPNNWDSMTYHMSRVMHWIQNHSVSHYPTSILRQLDYTPWAEFAILHFQILSAADRWANLIQWFSLAGCMLGVSLIAQQLGACRRGQILSSVIAATIPMGILQASSTQNDYVVAFWLVCFISFFLQWEKEARWYTCAAAGASLGLAFLTKGTAYLYAVPFLFWYIFCGWKQVRWKTWQILLTLLAAVLLINSGYYTRNFYLHHHILPPSESANINGISNPGTLASNILRNAALHLGTPFEGLNICMENGVSRLHSLLGLDIIDPRLTLAGEFHISRHPFHEDNAGNILHFFLILASVLTFAVSRHFRKMRLAREYLMTIMAAVLLFCLFLKWSPFHSRYHLPLFILASPLAGIVLAGPRFQKTGTAISIILLLCSLPWVFYNQSRPVLGEKNIFQTKRTEQYFANNPGFQYSYTSSVDRILSQGCSQVGLALGGDSWEYPLWVLFQNRTVQGREIGKSNFSIKRLRLEHVNVRNASSGPDTSYPLGDFHPCAIINDLENGKSKIVFNGSPYVKTNIWAFLSVFMKDNDGALAQKSLVYHFNKTLEYFNNSIRAIKIDGRSRPEDLRRIIQWQSEALKEARQISPDELNQLYQGLGDHFRSDFMTGCEQTIEGLTAPDKEKYQIGQKYLMTWGDWITENRDMIENVFKGD